MTTQQNNLEQLNAYIAEQVNTHLIASGSAYITDDGARVQMDIEHWRENARPMTAKGRAEIAAEDAAIASILREATVLGFDKPHQCGNGDGQNGGIVVYDLGKAAR
jgi:hypothetical protein